MLTSLKMLDGGKPPWIIVQDQARDQIEHRVIGPINVQVRRLVREQVEDQLWAVILPRGYRTLTDDLWGMGN